MADGEVSRRVELVATATPERIEAGRTGLGLVVGLVVGRSSLIGAATGAERFEMAIAHFVGVVLVSVAGALLLGALYDGARRSADAAAAAQLSPHEDGATDESDLPVGQNS